MRRLSNVLTKKQWHLWGRRNNYLFHKTNKDEARWAPTVVEIATIFSALHLFTLVYIHDDVKWKHFPRYWRFVRGIHRPPVNSPHKSQWRGALMFSFICVWTNGWVNNPDAGDLRRHIAHYDVTVMLNLITLELSRSRYLEYYLNNMTVSFVLCFCF